MWLIKRDPFGDFLKLVQNRVHHRRMEGVGCVELLELDAVTAETIQDRRHRCFFLDGIFLS